MVLRHRHARELCDVGNVESGVQRGLAKRMLRNTMGLSRLRNPMKSRWAGSCTGWLSKHPVGCIIPQPRLTDAAVKHIQKALKFLGSSNASVMSSRCKMQCSRHDLLALFISYMNNQDALWHPTSERMYCSRNRNTPATGTPCFHRFSTWCSCDYRKQLSEVVVATLRSRCCCD